MADTPTRPRFDVVSDVTGARVIADVPRSLARAEAQRLTMEAKLPVTADDGETPLRDPVNGDPMLVGDHVDPVTGVRVLTTYSVERTEVPDEAARIDELQKQVTSLKESDPSSPQLEWLTAEVKELRARRKELADLDA